MVYGMSELISDVPHDVDLCLVSPCEFQHTRTPENHHQHVITSLTARTSPGLSDNNNHSQDQSSSDCPSAYSQETPPTSVSESLPTATDSDIPPNTEECPSITADVDSDDDSSSLFPHDHPAQHYSHMGGQLSSHDPATCPSEGFAPITSPAWSLHGRHRGWTAKPEEFKCQDQEANGYDAEGVLRKHRSPETERPRAAGSDGSVVYVDLAYLHLALPSSTVDLEFFRRLRSSHYIVSGNDPVKEASMRSILDALLEGKSSWPEVQVTLIPTFDSLVMHEWYQETHDRQRELSITVLGSKQHCRHAGRDSSPPARSDGLVTELNTFALRGSSRYGVFCLIIETSSLCLFFVTFIVHLLARSF
ncbi:Microtubule-associated protein 1S [Nibea albiflora]|nr:Microtubule-associated protein 1S [Nibea albiflora]